MQAQSEKSVNAAMMWLFYVLLHEKHVVGLVIGKLILMKRRINHLKRKYISACKFIHTGSIGAKCQHALQI